jgi:hypothetical protein
MKEPWQPGGTPEYVANRGGKEVRLSGTLAPLPPDVMAMMLGLHLLEHVQAGPASK